MMYIDVLVCVDVFMIVWTLKYIDSLVNKQQLVVHM